MDLGKQVAVKEIDCFKDDEKRTKAYSEVNILKKLKHEHIVRYYGIREWKDSVLIYMEYAERGSLYTLISERGALYEKDVSRYCWQIVQALAYIHEQKIAHRDIKCSNVLLDGYDNCKLSDFGIAKQSQNLASVAGAHTLSGTVCWTSPEVLSGKNYGLKCDIWSLGCTVLEMLNKEPPYAKLNIPLAIAKLCGEELVPRFPPSTSHPCMVFTSMCLKKDPTRRPSAKELIDYEFIMPSNEL